jgi:hypothetical protein
MTGQNDASWYGVIRCPVCRGFRFENSRVDRPELGAPMVSSRCRTCHLVLFFQPPDVAETLRMMEGAMPFERNDPTQL